MHIFKLYYLLHSYNPTFLWHQYLKKTSLSIVLQECNTKLGYWHKTNIWSRLKIFTSLVFDSCAKDAVSEYDEPKIYDNAFKNYLGIKVFDDNVFAFVCVLTWSLLGVKKKLGPRPDRSPLGVFSKLPTSIPIPFICGVPTPRISIAVL